MVKQPERPQLTPQFCFSTGTLRDFLRRSRASLDDSITEQLNALSRPSRVAFDPNSTAQIGPRSMTHKLEPQSCAMFKDKILFPTWQVRTDVLQYCGLVAASPDPDDPEVAIRATESEKDKLRVVDERLDPYSGRFFPREPRTEQLAALIRMETGVENVVRMRTWDAMKERCGEINEWQAAFGAWRRKEGEKQES